MERTARRCNLQIKRLTSFTEISEPPTCHDSPYSMAMAPGFSKRGALIILAEVFKV